MKTKDEIKKELDSPQGEFYVYILWESPEKPIYVGKGKSNNKRSKTHRIFCHEAEAKHRKNFTNPIKVNAIRNIWDNGQSIYYSVDSWHNEEHIAFQREVELIATFGRRCNGNGPLTNITEGGDGVPDLPAKSRQQISDTLKLTHAANPELRKRQQEGRNKWKEERPHEYELTLEKGSITRRTEAYRERVSKERREYFQTHPEARDEMANKISRYHEIHPEFKNRLKQWRSNNPDLAEEAEHKRLETLKTPAFRERSSQIHKEYYANNPEARERISKTLKQYYEDNTWHIRNPEKHKELVEKRKNTFSTPEYRQKISERILNYFASIETTADRNKIILLEMAKRGESRPNSHTTKLGRALVNYTNGTDEVFSTQIRALAPHWFRDNIIEEKKSEILQIARNGGKKPISKRHPLGYCLMDYLQSDEEFRNQISMLRPDWLLKPKELMQEKKIKLLEMASHGASRPNQKNSELGVCLGHYTRPTSRTYDEEFDNKIRSLAPKWFVMSK